jgi:hypothetical protein
LKSRWMMTMKILKGERDIGLENNMVMISLFTSWMILTLLFHKPMHPRMLNTGRKSPVVRLIHFG